MKALFVTIALLVLISCGAPDQGMEEIPNYDGAIQSAEDMVLYHSEDARVKNKLVTPRFLEYVNGDKEFPEGLYFEFFDEEGNVTSTLKANEAYYFKEEDQWRGRGDVEVQSMEKNQKLNSEELFWKPKDEKIFTEKFVTITLPDKVLYGHGLTAKQDFSSYQIKKVQGTFNVEE
ncbi:LPS export ABC transporter periplasmic protein LptC [Fulvivirga sp. M361]|uniref:LPS export ABC transporter periplasmic protein LptC n=1 Tax=Fulvivirga sp. M361 TaxID=2594266 RepID=UPI001179D444|nr:LPS export ABC transporter periplasmic protein LptC [Fulvivirga sp. M361]TRX61331.1 LPS export ABC transporter periplasmic protein LptC [Fulvivirga sp. M361]